MLSPKGNDGFSLLLVSSLRYGNRLYMAAKYFTKTEYSESARSLMVLLVLGLVMRENSKGKS